MISDTQTSRPQLRPRRILCFGETIAEDIGGARLFSSAPFLTAAACALMGNDTVFFSRVGADETGMEAIRILEECGVDTSHVQRDATRPTGTAAGNDGAYAVAAGGAHGSITADRSSCDKIASQHFDVFCFETLAQAFPDAAQALSALLHCVESQDVFYDCNLRGRYFNRAIFESSFHAATIARLNEEEAHTVSMILFGRAMPLEQFAASICKTFFVPLVCVRRADGGCVLCRAGRLEEVRTAEAAPKPRRPGIGAVYNAAFLSAYVNGRQPRECAAIAADFAAFTASQSALIPRYPDSLLGRLRLL